MKNKIAKATKIYLFPVKDTTCIEGKTIVKHPEQEVFALYGKNTKNWIPHNIVFTIKVEDLDEVNVDYYIDDTDTLRETAVSMYIKQYWDARKDYDAVLFKLTDVEKLDQRVIHRIFNGELDRELNIVLKIENEGTSQAKYIPVLDEYNKLVMYSEL